ncbi:glycosyltransferase family A protein [Legionella taurinensis]|nr:glycosyltransferase family 2 protein [Legionella taurinensis]MDX1837062.1 glycosyltransferase family 2 protein [Legionella taurinensis]RJT48181.1 glycosyltransferase [Legionella taurinensis]STY25919.1 putative glycosyl transferase [Legionella taurinensis]
MSETIAVCVCTCMRPQMLERCLLSLIQQECLDDWNLIFIVVDNESSPNNQSLVERFQSKTNFPVVYRHEARRGISTARNAALEEALSHKADWVCFFDDDQYADKQALKWAYSWMKEHDASVVSMNLTYVDQAYTPSLEPIRDEEKTRARALQTCGTGGVLFSASLIHPDGLALRFDESYALSGGGDAAFFFAAFKKGAKMIRSKKAVVFEEITGEHFKLRTLLFRTYCTKLQRLKMNIKYRRLAAVFAFVLSSILFPIAASIELFLLPLYRIYSKRFFHKRLASILRKYVRLVVLLTCPFAKPQMYKKIIGY